MCSLADFYMCLFGLYNKCMIVNKGLVVRLYPGEDMVNVLNQKYW